MFDVEKQVAHWRDMALSDIESAEILVEKGKYLHGLFFCHLVIEKALKAHFVKFQETLPPKTHDLPYLISKTDIVLTKKQENLCAILMEFQLEGRYPEYNPKVPSLSEIDNILSETKELLEWLTKKL